VGEIHSITSFVNYNSGKKHENPFVFDEVTKISLLLFIVVLII